MKLQMSSANRTIVAMLVVAALAAAFWILLLGPKREEARELGAQVEKLEQSLARHEAEIAEGEEAREQFPVDYRQLVVLGKAVPGDDDTPSLLVQLNRIAKGAGVRFSDFTLSSEGGGEAAPAPTPPVEGSGGTPASTPVSPTEAAASTLPLGATIGPAGLAVMPYTLSFDGDFFELADFIKGLDALVETESDEVAVKGRLITIDGFSLAAGPGDGFPNLEATFGITTYLTSPEQGATGGGTPSGPAEATATPAATTTGGTP